MNKWMLAVFGMISILAITFLYSTLTSPFTNSPHIKRGRYNPNTTSIEIDIAYGGGCVKHKFQLQMGKCRENNPVQCDAVLIDLATNDRCLVYIQQTVSIGLHEVGLNNSYYAGASIEIQGSDHSKILITLPK